MALLNYEASSYNWGGLTIFLARTCRGGGIQQGLEIANECLLQVHGKFMYVWFLFFWPWLKP